jgi:hypothetical protein
MVDNQDVRSSASQQDGGRPTIADAIICRTATGDDRHLSG